jgi:anti-anti-sigma factor
MRQYRESLGVSDPGPSTLRLDTVTQRERSVVIVRGDVDSSTAPQLGAVLDAIADDVRHIEIDMRELRFLDSTGIGVLATCIDRLAQVDGKLAVSNVPPPVMRLLRITDLLRFVHVASELKE